MNCKHIKLIIALSLMLVSASALRAQDARHSFAIVIDSGTYNACQSDVNAYRDAIRAQGLDAFVEARNWESPEELAAFLRNAHSTRSLDGAVFIGDIPIAMVSRAQHMTSAFKMAQDPDDLFNTSVPSDRFYDDFDLKFDFVSSQDTLGYRYFYYSLSGYGEQDIECDIYTGRIKPSLDGEQGYVQVRKYLRKAVAEKKSGNRADRIVSFTGSGSFSNSLIAWKDESVTLKEQFPEAFLDSDGARFYFFSMYPVIKDIAIKELGREEVDLTLFHEHGVPDVQYVGGEIPVVDYSEEQEKNREDMYEAVLRKIRSSFNSKVRYGSTEEEAIASISSTYGLDSTWFTTLHDPEAAKADSAREARTLILLSEVPQIAPNSRITLFDACYNGDIREKDCIASSYIFSDGKAVVSLANTVNVLQDKFSSDLLGLLACGYNVGQVCQMTNILESHIIGDPTMTFVSDINGPDYYNDSVPYWKDVLSGDWPADIRSLALYKLYRLNYEDMPALLAETYRNSKDYTERLECFQLAAHYSGDSYIEMLKDALDDPFEFIRRKAVYWCGETGDRSFVPLIAQMYMDDYMALRLDFNISTAVGYYGDGVKEAVASQLQDSFIFDKEAFMEKTAKSFDAAVSLRDFMADMINDPETKPARFSSYINSVRNSPDPAVASALIDIVSNPSRDMQMRIDAAEALGWFVRYNKRGEIIDAFQKQIQVETDKALCDELAKTINRLKAYSR